MSESSALRACRWISSVSEAPLPYAHWPSPGHVTHSTTCRLTRYRLSNQASLHRPCPLPNRRAVDRLRRRSKRRYRRRHRVNTPRLRSDNRTRRPHRTRHRRAPGQRRSRCRRGGPLDLATASHRSRRFWQCSRGEVGSRWYFRSRSREEHADRRGLRNRPTPVGGGGRSLWRRSDAKLGR